MKILGMCLCQAICSAVNSFDSSPQLDKICLFCPCSQQNLSMFSGYAHRCVVWLSLFSLTSSDEVGSLFGGRLVWSPRPVSLLVQVPRGVCAVQ